MSSENEKVIDTSDKSLEKGVAPGYVLPVGNDDDDRYHFSSVDTDRVHRSLKQRHVQMYSPSLFSPHVSR